MSKVYEQIFRKLYRLVPNLDSIPEGEAVKLKSEGFMDLNIDVLHREPNKTRLAMSHYYKHPSGDMIPDPDMEIVIYHDRKMAEALSYQDSFGYRTVYPEEGKVYPKARRELNSFLNQWLNNLRMQGHSIESEDKGRSDFMKV